MKNPRSKFFSAYLFLVILTPVFNVPSLPPLRFDDALLLVLGLVAVSHGSLQYIFKSTTGRLLIFLFLWCSFSFTVNLLRFNLPLWSGISPLLLVVRMVLIGTMIHWVSRWDRQRPEILLTATRVMVIAGSISALIYLLQIFRVPLVGFFFTQLYSSFGDKYSDGYLYKGLLFRSPGTMGNPNFQGSLLALSILSVWTLLRVKAKSRYRTWLLVGCGLLMLATLFATGSRTAVVALIISLCGYEFIKLFKSRRIPAGLIVIAAVGSAALLFFLSFESPLTRVVDRSLSVLNFQENSIFIQLEQSRGIIWRFAIDKINADGLWFIGSGAEPDFVIDSGYLQNIYQYGIVGLAVIMTLYIFPLFHLISRRENRLSNFDILVGAFSLVYFLIGVTFAATWTAKLGPLLVLFLFCNELSLSRKRTSVTSLRQPFRDANKALVTVRGNLGLK